MCIAPRWQGRGSAQTPQSDTARAELGRLYSSDLMASLSQCELGDCAIFNLFRAPVAPCEPEGHDIAFRFGEKSLAEVASGRRNDEPVARDQIKELMEGLEIGLNRWKNIDVVMRQGRQQHVRGTVMKKFRLFVGVGRRIFVAF
jgi:hypothetical protein